MKRAIVSAILSAAAFILTAATLHAQTVAGTWQGTLLNGGNARVVLTFKKNSDGSFHGGMTLIDHAFSAPLSSVTFSAPDVGFALSPGGPNYRGKLSADGKSISGTWTQGNQSFPLTLQLATTETLWKRPAAMASDADPSFEVAIIKPAQPEEIHPIFDLHARNFNAVGTSAKELIKIAYNVRGRQVSGGPPWLEDRKYDIVGEPDTLGIPSENQSRAMVHKLLTERFHLVSHTETQLFPVLALTLNSKGPRPKPSDPDFEGSFRISGTRDGDDLVLEFSGATMQQFLAHVMNAFQDKQLVDETGLSGIYDISLRLTGVGQRPITSDDYGNALILAAQRAGFKFVSKKEPLKVVVVDHIDPPTAN